MRIPESLAPLFDYGIVDEVVRPLMSGKEAQVFVVISGGRPCVAKVYKESQNRTFKHRAEYTEGRKVRNSRDQRAIGKRSKHGRAQDEAAWRSTEVDVIRRLHAAGVRVPEPLHFVEGVLLMELVTDADGNPAPRLADLSFDPDAARAMYERLLREVIRMLCAGIVHGDLSDFNVLVGAGGPVIIDFPQSVDTAHNSSARKLLLRDVDNLHRFLGQFAPNARRFPYAEEMWELFQQNAITPETRLTGRFRSSERRANTHEVLEAIQDANYDERKRREALGLRGGPPVQGAQAGPAPRRGPPQPHGRPAHGAPTAHGSPGGPSHGTKPARPFQGRPPHRPAPSRDGYRSAPAQGGAPAPARRAPPPREDGGPSRSPHPRHEPARSGPAHGPPARSPQAPQARPPHASPVPHARSPQAPQGAAPRGGGPPPEARRRAPDPSAAGARGPRSHGLGGRRDEETPVEVIVARRPPASRG